MSAISPSKNNLPGPVAIGALAGLVGVFALDRVANYLYRRRCDETRRKEERVRVQLGGDDRGPISVLVENMSEKLRIKLTDQQFTMVFNVIHYGLGVIPGAIYGALLSQNNKIGVGRGIFYGTTLFLVNDEFLSFKLGLAAKPSAYPWQSHARGLASHWALGLATHWSYQGLNHLFRQSHNATEPAKM